MLQESSNCQTLSVQTQDAYAYLVTGKNGRSSHAGAGAGAPKRMPSGKEAGAFVTDLMCGCLMLNTCRAPVHARLRSVMSLISHEIMDLCPCRETIVRFQDSFLPDGLHRELASPASSRQAVLPTGSVFAEPLSNPS